MDLNPVFRGILYLLGAILTSILINIIRQSLPRRKSEPPLVFHWLPLIGNAIEYGTDPLNFYRRCRAKHGDIFTFVLLGKRLTVCLGPEGNEFVLNGRVSDVNAEDIYRPLTAPVFGSDVVYDCPNAKLMEQKRFVKFGLTRRALESYVPLIEKEVLEYISPSSSTNPKARFQGEKEGRVNVSAAMAEITIFTAGRALQGAEVRAKLTTEFAELYHDLDMGFQPINFLMPWAPLPQNRRRDAAHLKMRSVYMELINERRKSASNKAVKGREDEEPDMISNLMTCVYKNGNPIPDKEIANIMITLLMGGQHSSSSTSAWIMHRLAAHPTIQEELYTEQAHNLPPSARSRPLTLNDLDQLPLLSNVIKETLRLHSSIHTLMRKVKRALPVPGTDYVITPDKVLVSSPIMSHMSAAHFADPEVWDPHRWEEDNNNERINASLLPSDDSTLTTTTNTNTTTTSITNSNIANGAVNDDEDIIDYGYGLTRKGTKSPYLPFGAGRHRCIGEKFAYLNLATIILTIIRNLKLRTVDGTTASVPPTDYTSLFSRPVQSAEILWERRRQA